MDSWVLDDQTRVLSPPEREVVIQRYGASRATRFRENPEQALVEAAVAMKREK
ncbi:MAG: hypothetical protein Q8S33_29005 [Myxococcales bacterium]|nr:hypothetical protein [Myxococcales bacterium]